MTAYLAVLFVFDAPDRNLTLDGRFEDWAGLEIPAYSAAQRSAVPSLNLISYAAKLLGSELWVWASVEGTIFSDPAGWDTVHVFLDVDGSATTGYLFEGIGADYRVGVTGGDLKVDHTVLFRFASEDPHDWRGWRPVLQPRVAVSRSAMELRVPTPDLKGFRSSFLVVVAVEGNDGEGSVSTIAVGGGQNAILATVHRTRMVANESDPIGDISLTLFGRGTATISGVDLEVEGPAVVEVLGLPMELSADAGSFHLPLVVSSLKGARPGDVVRAAVVGVSATSPVTLDGGEVAAYLISSSPVKRIDGLFADWQEDRLLDPGAALQDPNVDILAHGAGYDATASYLYVKVVGDAFGGGRVPLFERRRGSAEARLDAPDSVGTVRRSAEDRLVAWIDIDPGHATGDALSGIGADWRIELLGYRGRVTRAFVYEWGNGRWVPSSLQVDGAAVSGGEIEVRIPTRGMGQPEVVVDLRDWRGLGDTTTSSSRPMRSQTLPTFPVDVPSLVRWPPFFATATLDLDDGADPAVEILEAQRSGVLGDRYMYVRIVVEASLPKLRDHTWWLYVDNGPDDGNNDWLIEERTGTLEICSYAWDVANGDWGTGGSGCDVTASLRDSDEGSAVRVVSNCAGTRGCIDFAIDKYDYPGIGAYPFVTVASDLVEDLDLLGNVNRNPVSAPGGCSVVEFDDCSSRFWVVMPEFPELMATVALTTFLLLTVRPRIRSRH